MGYLIEGASAEAVLVRARPAYQLARRRERTRGAKPEKPEIVTSTEEETEILRDHDLRSRRRRGDDYLSRPGAYNALDLTLARELFAAALKAEGTARCAAW